MEPIATTPSNVNNSTVNITTSEGELREMPSSLKDKLEGNSEFDFFQSNLQAANDNDGEMNFFDSSYSNSGNKNEKEKESTLVKSNSLKFTNPSAPPEKQAKTPGKKDGNSFKG